MRPGILKQNLVISSGDLRLSANQNCWATQLLVEENLIAAIDKLGGSVQLAYPHQLHKIPISNQQKGITYTRSFNERKLVMGPSYSVGIEI